MICLMFLTIMCLATQKNILCKLLKLYHQQQQQQGGKGEGKGQGEVGLRLRGRSFLGFIFGGQWRWRLLSPPLLLAFKCKWRRLALPPPPLLPSCSPPVLALLFYCPHASNFLAVINLGLLSWLTRLPSWPKSSLAYLCASLPSSPPSLFLVFFSGFFITRMTRFSSTSLILTLAIILGSGKL